MYIYIHYVPHKFATNSLLYSSLDNKCSFTYAHWLPHHGPIAQFDIMRIAD